MQSARFGGCAQDEAFRYAEIRSAYDAARSRVLEAVRPREAAALRDFAEERFPAAPDPNTKDPCFRGWSVVSKPMALSLWNAFEEFLRLLERNANVIALPVTSRPTGASIKLRPKRSDDFELANTTDTTLENVYRGVYRLRVVLSDHKAIDGMILNLVDVGYPKVRCDLKPMEDSGESTCWIE